MKFLQKIRERLRSFISSGLSPKQLALTIALGVAFGILPILWGTTLLCAATAYVFRLNQAGIQLVNYLCYPLQLALLLPFYRLGEKILPSSDHAAAIESSLSITSVFSLFGGAVLKAVMAWMLTAPFVILILYFVFFRLFRKKFSATPKSPSNSERSCPLTSLPFN